MNKTYARFTAKTRALFVGTVLAMTTSLPAVAGTTVSVNAGPVLLPNVPVKACIDTTCVSTPALGSVTLNVTATVTNLLDVLPKITATSCPYGQTGVAVLVEANLSNTSVTATVQGLVTGLTVTKTLGPVVVPVNRTVTVSACTI